MLCRYVKFWRASFPLAVLLVPTVATFSGRSDTPRSQSGELQLVATAPGRITGASQVISVGTDASGTITELLVREGDHVHAGQALVRIQCGHIQQELRARRSELEAAEAALQRVLHGPRSEEIAIGVANVALAEAKSQEAEKALRRALALHEGITITRMQLDQIERDARIAAAQLASVRATLALLRAGSRAEDIAEAQSRRDAAKARVEEAAARVDYCTVRAPSDAVVLSTNVTPGQFVSSAVPATLVNLVDDSKRRVQAKISQRDFSKICPQQQATITSDAFPGMELTGTLQQMGTGLRENALRPGDLENVAGSEFFEVTLSLPDNPPWPVGLGVAVRFAACR